MTMTSIADEPEIAELPMGRPVGLRDNAADAVMPAIIGAQPVAVQRDDARVMQKIRALAAAAGERWFYRFPVKQKGGGQGWIEGPSITLANDISRVYGNCVVDVRAFDQGESWMFYARFVDLETGYAMTRAFQQRKGQQSIGTRDQGRQLDIAFQIGQSKAIRNVVVNALQTLADFAFDEARNNLVAKIGKQIDQYREKVRARLAEMKVDHLRVEATIGRPLKDWLAADVARVIAEIQSVNDGMANADDVWPPVAAPRPTRAQVAEPAKDEAAVTAEAEAMHRAMDREAMGKPPAPMEGE